MLKSQVLSSAYFFIASFLVIAGCSSMPSGSVPSVGTVNPPIVAQKPYVHTKFGEKREDPYFWLKQREDKDVLAYLNAENDYAAGIMAETQKTQEILYRELRARIKEADQTVPVRRGNYLYYFRTEKDKEYKIYGRKRNSELEPEELLLDVNEMAKGQSYYSVIEPVPNTDQEIIAYAVDNVGRRFYDIYFKDLKTGKILPDRIEKTTGDFVWANDNKTIFYTVQNPETLRAEKVFRYKLGSGEKPQQVYFEKDETFAIGIGKSISQNHLFIFIGSTLSSEVRFLDANQPEGQFQVFLPREKNHEYSLYDGGDRFYVLTNWQAKNFRLMEASIPKGRSVSIKSQWKEVIPHSPNRLIEDIRVFEKYIAVLEKEKALSTLSILSRESNYLRYSVPMKDPIYQISFGPNFEYKTEFVRYIYESMNTPISTFDLIVKTKETFLRKEVEILGGFKPELYESKRAWAKAKDGTLIPLSILIKKGTTMNGGNPLLLYGYGSYGYSMEAEFDRNIFSLIDRGFIYVIAHIRGGSEMGRKWYENGRQEYKKNTFLDFISAAEYLIKQKYTSPAHLYIEGRSAGGLLMGSVLNMRPDLFHGAIAEVPFVDALTTMLDDSIPLTTGEYDEWGNPNVEKYYQYIKSYSPYDNIKPQAYPNILVSTGLHDSQVQYWEPAKWVARLRMTKTDHNLLLLKTEMEEGHSGKTGRYQRLKDLAYNYAWYLKLEDGKR